jgi:hypothetical protein
MSQGNYEGISIRDAMERINANNNGWFLPNIQRQYVWGARDSSEEYICLLLDSLVKGYPIGGLVLWETTQAVPYRKFLDDYSAGKATKIVPEEAWGNHKYLVYDGQQRLQTLYSVLFHRFNGRVLYFNLFFDTENAELDETGFFFKSPEENAPMGSIAMIRLMGREKPEDKIALRRELETTLGETDSLVVEKNLERLWDVFVKRDVKSIAYFPVKSNFPKDVNEVFRRLNTGGIQLTQLELVLSKINAVSTFFEETLWEVSGAIKAATGGSPGYEFTATDIVQLLYLLIFRTTRVDESKVNDSTVAQFVEVFGHVQKVLPFVFKYFFFEEFHINAKWLVPRQQALLPLFAYFIELERNGWVWEPQKISDMGKIRTYFVKSQLCDWNTTTMATTFSRIAMEAAKQNTGFPLEDITRIAVEKNRTGEVYFYQLEAPVWFSLKILTPTRLYLFNERKPQIDHIFPQALKSGTPDDADYRQRVDVLWNLQPAPAGINRKKWVSHPVDYFKSEEGAPFLACYDFLPSLDSPDFQNEVSLISFRKQCMLDFLSARYGVEIRDNPEMM